KSNAKCILVEQSGKLGTFRHSARSHRFIPSNNKQWTIIHLNPERKFKSLKKNYLGKRWRSTVIEWGDYGKSLESSTFKLSVANFMARDWAKTNIILSCSLLVAEASAIKLGMQVASSDNHSTVVLENDSKECILQLSHHLRPSWSIEGLVQDVKREANIAAHALAKWVLSCNFASLFH
ncbi:hypothetical protein CFP56_034490, partial [Quercus suber]